MFPGVWGIQSSALGREDVGKGTGVGPTKKSSENRKEGQGLEQRPLLTLWLALQLAVDALEQEKQGLQSQIAQILEGGQQLAHLKMSLSLEVATYRYTDVHTRLTPCLKGPGT